MILDSLRHASYYRSLPTRLVAALEYLQRADLLQLSPGKHEINGERLFALVQDYTPKPAEQCRLEAHRRYWDVQYVARGFERMGISTLDRVTVQEPYSAERDVAFFTGPYDLVTAAAGMFAIFGPQDVHMPGVLAETPIAVRKIVMKVDSPFDP